MISLTVAMLFFVIFLKNGPVPVFGILLSFCGGLLLIWKIFPYFYDLITGIRSFGTLTGVKSEFWGLLLKVIAITYLGDFTAQLCCDAGESGLASKLELGVKVIIMVMALPLWEEILKTVIEVFG